MSYPPGRSSGYAAGVPVTASTVGGLPAAKEAIRIAAEQVAKLELGVWRGKGVDRTRVEATWQARFFSGQANSRDSWFLAWEQTEASLTGRNNAYWLKVPDDAGRVAAIHVLHPDMVEPRWNKERGRAEYRILVPWSWQPSDWLDESRILHFRVGAPEPGALVAPSPVALFQATLGAAIAKQRYEGKFYERGLGKSIVASFPMEITPDAAKRYREALEGEHGGVDQQFGVRVFGGGATITTIGLSLQDAQYIESMQFSVEEIARIFGVQASLLGGGTQSQVTKPLSPEHEEDRWLRYGLGPRLERIEQTVKADPAFFGVGARDYPMFDTGGVLRGDLETEARIAHSKVQAGIWLPDEARAKEGLPPLPDGVGTIPQIVPVGGAPTPLPLAPPDEEA
jgi:HK97 family phage portal protein